MNFKNGCKYDANVDLLANMHTFEFLNKIKCLSIPNHNLELNVGTCVMLLRYIDYSISQSQSLSHVDLLLRKKFHS